ncbi:MAG: TonB-dependent receptor plug domain-containing protein [Prevotellaceae bacterium]|nr:TonB-dependent receptor plug domain-containing protein [Prevotellaceae bacterium]
MAQESASTQSVILRGKVVDATNIPIIGASVFVEGTSFATTTNADGDFSLTATITPESKLRVTFVGMEPYAVAIGSERNFLVELLDDAETLEAAVVTGFQSISRTSFTGSSSVVKAEDLKVKGAVDVSRMLEGQVAGVTIQNVSRTFGSAPKVRVRGATSLRGENKPLWVIDGVAQEDITTITNDQLTSGDPTTLLGSAIAGLNGNDIESINVLKDAATTALYGARAMNGVVVVTTKRGQEGRPRVSYSGNFSVNLRPSYANYDIMNSAEQMSVYAEMERKGLIMSDIVNYSNSGVYGKCMT